MEYRQILNWAFKHGYNIGLVSQKLFEIKAYVYDFDPINAKSEEFRNNLLEDINYLDEIVCDD